MVLARLVTIEVLAFDRNFDSLRQQVVCKSPGSFGCLRPRPCLTPPDDARGVGMSGGDRLVDCGFVEIRHRLSLASLRAQTQPATTCVDLVIEWGGATDPSASFHCQPADPSAFRESVGSTRRCCIDAGIHGRLGFRVVESTKHRVS